MHRRGAQSNPSALEVRGQFDWKISIVMVRYGSVRYCAVLYCAGVLLYTVGWFLAFNPWMLVGWPDPWKIRKRVGITATTFLLAPKRSLPWWEKTVGRHAQHKCQYWLCSRQRQQKHGQLAHVLQPEIPWRLPYCTGQKSYTRQFSNENFKMSNDCQA